LGTYLHYSKVFATIQAMKKQRLNFRCNEQEMKMVNELAADLGTNMSDAVFRAVRHAYLNVDLLLAMEKFRRVEEE